MYIQSHSSIEIGNKIKIGRRSFHFQIYTRISPFHLCVLFLYPMEIDAKYHPRDLNTRFKCGIKIKSANWNLLEFI